MNVLEARESESLEKLATDTASTNHKDLRALQKPKSPKYISEKLKLKRGREIRVFEGGGEYLYGR